MIWNAFSLTSSASLLKERQVLTIHNLFRREKVTNVRFRNYGVEGL
jgi:hypothetical protein